MTDEATGPSRNGGAADVVTEQMMRDLLDAERKAPPDLAALDAPLAPGPAPSDPPDLNWFSLGETARAELAGMLLGTPGVAGILRLLAEANGRPTYAGQNVLIELRFPDGTAARILPAPAAPVVPVGGQGAAQPLDRGKAGHA